MKRKLSVRDAVERAAVVFEMNAETKAVLGLGMSAGLFGAGEVLPDISDRSDIRARFLYEWRGFAHAAVLNALMEHAPGVTVLEYLRATTELLGRLGYAAEDIEGFTDTAFKAYSDSFINKKPEECPRIFFDRLSGVPLEKADKHAAAVISGTMAMLTAAALDVFEKYEYMTE